MEKNWDADVKRFFVKILNSISLTLAWIMASAIAGIYFQLGYQSGKPMIYTVIFYVLMVGTLVLLIRHLYKVWK